jgi:Protein of unknown function (DUF2889)
MAASDNSVTREALHTRVIDMTGYKRSDGLYEIEGHITDTKPVDFKAPNGPREVLANTPLHEMRITLVYDQNMVVQDVLCETLAAPYNPCFEAPATLQVLKGLSIASGWAGEVRKRLGGGKSCSHLVHMLGSMAATAYQSLTVERSARPTVLDADGKPLKIESCYAYGTDREVVMKMWPKYYTGPKVIATTDVN